MLRPPHGIANRGCFIGPRGIREYLGHFQELLFRNAAHRFNELRRVAREVTLQHVKDATGVLKRGMGILLVVTAGFSASIFALAAACAGVPRSRSIAVLRGPLIQQSLGAYFFCCSSHPEKT